MSATWELVKFEKQDPSGTPSGVFVGMVGRVVYGYNQINDPNICALGNCCPAEGDVANYFFPGNLHLPHACFGMLGQMFWDYPHEYLNDGTLNPNWNGCAMPHPTATGFNTCGFGTDNVIINTGTQPCECGLGEFYTAIPNIDFTQTGPGVQWLIVNNTTGNGQLDCCVEILKIVDNQSDWDNNTVTCPSQFLQSLPTPSTQPPGSYLPPTLFWMSIGGVPTSIVETNCETCVGNLYGCLDPNAINTYWDCNGVHIPTVYGQNPNLNSGCCIYPGCPDSSALNYDPTDNDGCGTWSSGSWVSGGPTDTSCCQYPGCNDNVTVLCSVGTPLPNGDPGPVGCVSNYGLDCFGNVVIPVTGGILVNPGSSNCFTNEIPPSPNNDCYYVGCTDQTASNYTPGANGCLYPDLDGTQCCEYEGCMDPTAVNYGESCNDPMVIYSAAQLTAPCVPDNCIDPPVIGCMDDGCCVDGVLILVDPTVTTQCPNGLHLCPQAGSGVSFSSNFPVGCTPGVDCVSCSYDPMAEEQGMPYANYCTCEGGWYCDLSNNPGCTPGVDCCIDVYASTLIQPYFPTTDPNVFGPCGPNTGYPCINALADCNDICEQPDLEECAVFVNDRQGNVYFYGPPDTAPNTLTFLFHDDQFNENSLPDGTPLFPGSGGGYNLGWQSGTGSWDIANAIVSGTVPEQNKIWLYSCRVLDIDNTSANYGQVTLETVGPNIGLPKGIIREYDITINPFNVGSPIPNQPMGANNPTYNRDIDITDLCQTHGLPTIDASGNVFKTIGNALVAKDEFTLISVSDVVLEIDISGPVGVATELFKLPSPTYPGFNPGFATSQAESTGDVVVDVNTGDLTITYFHAPDVTGKLIGKFSLNAGVGGQMGDSAGNPTNWYEILSNDTGISQFFGLFRWIIGSTPQWYGIQQNQTGGEIYEFDNTTLTVNNSVGLVTTLPPDTLSVPPFNEILGASQRDGCTADDPCGCMDPTALNYDPNAVVHCPPCIYPPEPRFGCLPRLTKEEFMMNVVQKPETYSDVFIERGKVSVFERPQRLAQVSTIGELELHGYGYYKILTQE
tara:strand:- start:19669 stop:22860 length:3192 start_codon:yes stop_codon:yes gene_type:complete